MKDLSAILRREAATFLDSSSGPRSVEEINSGSCADFASYIIESYGEIYGLDLVDSYDFYEDGIWDKSFGMEQSGNAKYVTDDFLCSHPVMHTLYKIASIDKNYLSSHVFMYSKITRMFYDAERPDGVSDPFELPIFGRFINEAKEALTIDKKEAVFDLQSAVDSLSESKKNTSPKIG